MQDIAAAAAIFLWKTETDQAGLGGRLVDLARHFTSLLPGFHMRPDLFFTKAADLRAQRLGLVVVNRMPKSHVIPPLPAKRRLTAPGPAV